MVKKITFFLLLLTVCEAFSQCIIFKSSNESLEIKDKKISYSVTSYTYPSPQSATPSGSETRVIFDKLPLKKAILKELKNIIKKSNFYSLPATSGASANQRYYGESLYISLNGKSHTVVYRSNPNYPSPFGYDKIKSEIFNVIDKIKK